MKKITILVSVFFIGLFTGCSDDATTDIVKDLSAKKMLDVSYGGDSEQVYDIYLPENRTENTKTMILVHGGGWNSGDKSDMDPFKDLLKEQLHNIAIVNINYRLADENNVPHPMQVNDITAVVEHLKSNQSDYVISDTIGFLGVSAGGHLSLLWSYAYDTNAKVSMVCSIVGPTNLIDEAYTSSTNPDIRALITQYGADVDFLKSASPLYQVKATSPPTQLFYGGQDPLIPNSQGQDLNSKLQELDVTKEFTFYPNAGHGWVGLELLDTSLKLKAFIELHL